MSKDDSDRCFTNGRLIEGEDAWCNVLRIFSSRWSAPAGNRAYPETAHGRIAAGICLPKLQPKFILREDDAFFCIGSCFARNIEEHLLYRDLRVTSKSIAMRRDGTTRRPNGFVNKFTTISILNELRWSLGESAFPEGAIVEDKDGWLDLQLAPTTLPAPRERVLERRRTVTEYFSRIREATVVVITLGLVEAWYDRSARVFLNAAPSLWATRHAPGRFVVSVTDYDDNRKQLEEIIAILGRHVRKDLRIILTVSPVPMSETFSGGDVITANAYSKSTLRAAAEDTARRYDHVEYFPSYDAILSSNRRLVYSTVDELHILDAAVEAVTTHFLTTFGIARERSHPEFNELEYLIANPDVHDAVAEGRLTSGYEHWLVSGRAERRPLRLLEGRPTFLDMFVDAQTVDP